MALSRVVLLLLVLCTLQSCLRKEPAAPLANVEYDPFLDSLSQKTFNYFWDLTNRENGLVPDRWPSPSFSSIAATGFGLTTYLIGVERGYIKREEAAARVLTTLRFFQNAPKGDATAQVTGNHGFFYHFLDMKTGMRFREVELSTIDTGLLIVGILSCGTYFNGTDEVETEIRSLADSLFEGVEWDWAMNGQKTMSMGWHPERGFLDAKWRGFNEAMILYVMAIASPSHPIAAESWKAWTDTYQWGNYQGQEHLNFGPLFGHQYSQMYIDFRGIKDEYMSKKGIDYFENARRATYANRSYCIDNPGAWKGYSENFWGLTACDGPGNDQNNNPNVSYMGYSARGAAQWYTVDDGTIAPTAAGGSIPFAPEICIPALKAMRKDFGTRLYDQYGFKDAYNLSITNDLGEQGWFDPDYIGIDQGPIVIQVENFKSGFVWELMKKNPVIIQGLKKAGFAGGWLDAM